MNCIDCKLAKNTIIFGVLTLIIITLSYNFVDIKVATLIHTSDFFGTGISTLAAFISKIFSPKIWAVVTAIVTVLCILLYIAKKPSDKLYIMSLTLIMTIIITTVIKISLARYRPELLLFDNRYGFHFFSMKKVYNSMPSGHTALSFAGLLAIANFFNKKVITLIAVILACLIAVSRIIVLDHFVSDVILAAYIGIFTYLWAKAFVENKKYIK